MTIKENKIVVVGGGGHVGLPFGVVLAHAGKETVAFDISNEKVDLINNGVFPFLEENGEIFLKDALSKGLFLASTDPRHIADAKFVVVIIGTPVDEHLSPNPNSVVDAVREILYLLHHDQILILRSTVFPGVTRRIEELLNDNKLRTKVAYCPERIIEGKAIEEIRSLPQIVGCSDNEIFSIVKDLFSSIGVESIRTSAEEAELAKLFTNTWRYIKFAAANQFWMMANDLGVDFDRVRHAITYKYPRAIDLPGPGFAAGPCLFKDTMQLSALVRQSFPLGHSALMINEGVPAYVVGQLKEKYKLRNLTIGILGAAFKANVDDIRSSLAFKLRKLLNFECRAVLMTDPFVVDDRLISLDEVIMKSDLLVIAAPHDAYRELQTQLPIVDIWGLRGKGTLIP